VHVEKKDTFTIDKFDLYIYMHFHTEIPDRKGVRVHVFDIYGIGQHYTNLSLMSNVTMCIATNAQVFSSFVGRYLESHRLSRDGNANPHSRGNSRYLPGTLLELDNDMVVGTIQKMAIGHKWHIPINRIGANM
jgi:hypothetical protein